METDRESRRGRKVESWRRAARGGPARGFLLQQQLHHKLSLDGHAQTDQACLGFPAIISYRDEKRTSSSKTLAFFFYISVWTFTNIDQDNTQSRNEEKGRRMYWELCDQQDRKKRNYSYL